MGSLLKFFYKEKIDENFLINNKSSFELPFIINKDKLNVGVAWSGSFNGPNEPYRSVPLESLNKIFSLMLIFIACKKKFGKEI